MNHHFIKPALIASLLLPTLAFAQPDGQPPNEPRPDRERPERDRGERGERDRDGDRDGDRDRRGEVDPLTDEQIDEAVATLDEMHPESRMIERIKQFVEKDREKAAHHLARFPRIRELMEMRRERPDEFALHVKQAGLMREVFPLLGKIKKHMRDGEDAQAKALHGALRKKIAEVFDVRIEMEKLEIERMKQGVIEAEEKLKRIEAEREAEIERRLKEMLEHRWDRRRRGDGDDKDDRPRERGERERPDKPEDARGNES